MSDSVAGAVITTLEDDVAVVEIKRPPNNYFDAALLGSVADGYEAAVAAGARAIVLQSEGKHFCAGADFSPRRERGSGGPRELYRAGLRLLAIPVPVVAAIQGAAIGGGMGLACSADFRIAGPNGRFHANFARLGFHHGFALTATLPWIVGEQRALDILLRAAPVDARAASEIGLRDGIADDPHEAARQRADDIAANAPLAIRSIRATIRASLVAAAEGALEHELTEQERLWQTADWREGIEAAAARRPPLFRGT